MLASDVFAQMANDDRWLGFGYIGARRNALDTSDPAAIVDPALIVEADALAIKAANRQQMTYEQLFRWANNKTGRWYGDTVFGGLPRASAERLLPGTRLH